MAEVVQASAMHGSSVSETVTRSSLIDKLEQLINMIEKTETSITAATQSWAIDPNKQKEAFRNYDDNPRKEMVELFYKNQHENITYAFVVEQRKKYLTFDRCVMTIWDMIQYLGDIVDESDPDTDLSQLEHAIQTAEAARTAYPDESYDWIHVAAFIHDLGKVMSVKDEKLGFVGEPQWGVVGDIFPVGCRFSEKNVFYKYFKNNPDFNDSRYNSKLGVYKENCGLDNIFLGWSHDEYLYNIAKDQSNLPYEALCMLRFHSFYPWHTEGDYRYLCNEKDLNVALKWTKIFNSFDLYSKSSNLPSLEEVAPYYKAKIEKYFPKPVRW